MIRLITPPLPAASRPSKMTSTLQAFVLDPVLHLDELDLEARQLLFVDLVFDLAGFGLDVAVMDFQRDAVRRAVGRAWFQPR